MRKRRKVRHKPHADFYPRAHNMRDTVVGIHRAM